MLERLMAKLNLLTGKLPAENLMDTVHVGRPVARVYRPFCDHKDHTWFSRTDHRPGPGLMSDSYSGVVCCACGNILQQTKTY